MQVTTERDRHGEPTEGQEALAPKLAPEQMAQLQQLIVAMVQRLFEPEQVASVLSRLRDCVQLAPDGEKARVQVGVLKLFDEDPLRDF